MFNWEQQLYRTLRILDTTCNKYYLQSIRSKLPIASLDGGLRRVPAVDIVKELLKHQNIDVNSGSGSISALARACACESIDIVMLLLQHDKIDINSLNPCAILGLAA